MRLFSKDPKISEHHIRLVLIFCLVFNSFDNGTIFILPFLQWDLIDPVWKDQTQTDFQTKLGNCLTIEFIIRENLTYNSQYNLSIWLFVYLQQLNRTRDQQLLENSSMSHTLIFFYLWAIIEVMKYFFCMKNARTIKLYHLILIRINHRLFLNSELKENMVLLHVFYFHLN